MNRLKKCLGCGKYTLSETCSCGSPAKSAHPPKFSPEDKYAKYRRMGKAAAVQ
ncbi:MAG: RNA-protein complex protein Nop10 [Candidatus Aenigmarchaeota archaeon]|nr:RNA-protein complex protein Nop10 [Candidatus Aenigmarchaeota archaeon]